MNYGNADDNFKKYLNIFLRLSACFLIGTGIGKMLKGHEEKKNAEKVTTCNAMVIANGEYSRQDNVEVKGKHDDGYDISYISDHSLVVFVYGEDIAQRYLYTEFIESNIEIKQNENGDYIVTLNQDNLTEENYKSFVNGLSDNKDNNGPQRVRE